MNKPHTDESTWERFRNQTATLEDLQAIWAEHDAQLADNPALKDCPDFRGYVGPLIWQLERMDCTYDAATQAWVESDCPTMADALRVFAELEAEE